MKRALQRTALLLLALVLLLAAGALWAIGPGNFARMFLGVGHVYDTQAPTVAALQRPAILIFSKTNGFRDGDQIAAANAAIEKLARGNRWSIYTTENAAIFNGRDLPKFDAVVWNSVSGDVLTTAQRSAFKGWIEKGGGFVGLHGAGGDLEYNWRWYGETLIGAQFIGHTIGPQFQRARLLVEDRDHSATRHLPAVWTRSDEWYGFATSPRAKGYHILVSIDEQSYAPRSHIPLLMDKDVGMGSDHPLVWTHCVGKGRAFYSALGHRAESYSEPAHLKLIGGAIAWAAGRDGPGCPG